MSDTSAAPWFHECFKSSSAGFCQEVGCLSKRLPLAQSVDLSENGCSFLRSWVSFKAVAFSTKC